MKALILIGLALNVVFLVVAVPFGRQFGGFGIAWSIGLVLILGYDFWTHFNRNRRRWQDTWPELSSPAGILPPCPARPSP